MRKEESKTMRFFRERRHEPFLIELFVYTQVIFMGAIMIFAAAIVNYFIDLFPEYKLKEVFSKLKESVFIAVISLFGLHILGSIFMRVIFEPIKKAKDGKDKNKNDKDGDAGDNAKINPNPKTEPKTLIPKPAIDEINEIPNSN